MMEDHLDDFNREWTLRGLRNAAEISQTSVDTYRDTISRAMLTLGGTQSMVDDLQGAFDVVVTQIKCAGAAAQVLSLTEAVDLPTSALKTIHDHDLPTPGDAW